MNAPETTYMVMKNQDAEVPNFDFASSYLDIECDPSANDSLVYSVPQVVLFWVDEIEISAGL